MKHLPEPDSQELRQLVSGASARAIYKVLYESMGSSVDMPTIRRIMGVEAGKQEHLNRRLRDLDSTFEIVRSRIGTVTQYRLIRRLEKQLNTEGISSKLRAWVLRGQRCAQCGRTPSEDRVRLHVDHKLPQAWGGTNSPENLQPLCSECNEGKKNFYATYDKYADQIRASANFEEPHKRIGELLKAFNGEFVPPDLIEIVANSKQYQDDWQKRLRELRTLGWTIEVEKRREAKRVKAYYSVKHFEPWPQGSVRAEITQLELRRKLKTQMPD